MDDQFDNISDRLAAAAEILRAKRESDARLDLALTLAGVGMWQWVIESNELTWDRRMCELFDESVKTEKTYETFIGKVIDKDKPRVQEAIDAALAGETYDIHYKIVAADGSLRLIHAKGLVYKNGSPDKMIGVCIEVANDPCGGC